MVEVFRGPTRIFLRPEFIVVSRKLFGLSETRKMDVRDLTNLRAHYTFSDEFGTHTAPGISVDYRGRTRGLGSAISEGEAEYGGSDQNAISKPKYARPWRIDELMKRLNSVVGLRGKEVRSSFPQLLKQDGHAGIYTMAPRLLDFIV